MPPVRAHGAGIQSLEILLKNPFLRALCLAPALLVMAHAARAHIEYYDLNQGMQIASLTPAGKAIAGNNIPLSNPAFWNVTYQTGTDSGETWSNATGSYASGTWGYRVSGLSLDSSAWTDGLRSDPAGGANLLGDSHRMAWANFHLASRSRVTLTLTDDQTGTGYGTNPSFSLYRGSLVYQAHDSVTVDPLNPKQASAPFSKIQSVKDAGNFFDSQGILSPYRNTFTNTGAYVGQFNALGGMSLGNESGDWSAVEFVAAATTALPGGYLGDWAGIKNFNTLTIELEAGDYVIAMGGNAQAPSYATARSAQSTSPFGPVSVFGTLDFQATTVSAVPEPATWGMLAGGFGVILFGIRRHRR